MACGDLSQICDGHKQMRELAPIGPIELANSSRAAAAAAGEDVSLPQTVLPVSNSVSHIPIQIFIFIFIFIFEFKYEYSLWDADSRWLRKAPPEINKVSLLAACASLWQLHLPLPLPLPQSPPSTAPSRCHRRVASNVIGSDSCIMILLNCA